MSDISGLSGPEDEDGNKKKKDLKTGSLISKSKDKKEKKSKEKETRYAQLGDESSGEDDFDGKSPAKTKLSKPFIFGSGRKEKRKDHDGAGGSSAGVGSSGHAAQMGSAIGMGPPLAGTTASSAQHGLAGSMKKKKDAKPKLKLIKSKTTEAEADSSKGKHPVEDCPIFGVPLEVAVERNRCHDGIPLPMVVRQCIDYIEENGLMMEGVYRSSGVKSKVNKLRAAFNSRDADQIRLSDYEPAVVASVLKQFLRELPEPVLTNQLSQKFEEVSGQVHPQKRIEGMKQLIAELPECNRTLLQWIFVHMRHVIERERFNKMTLQNVSIVLSPTMRISHRVLNCIFENSHILFDGVQLKKYIPPITSSSAVKLPESPDAIEEEIRKQESLLADLHLQISSGAATKKTEEQIWEQQRIVTQLKRKLRQSRKESQAGGAAPTAASSVVAAAAGSSNYEPIDYEEDLDFSLQVVPPHHQSQSSIDQQSPTKATSVASFPVVQPPLPQQQQELKKLQPEILSKMQPEQGHRHSSPEEAENKHSEHRVTVMVHRSDIQQQQQHPPIPQQPLQPQACPPVQQQQQQNTVQVVTTAQPLPPFPHQQSQQSSAAVSTTKDQTDGRTRDPSASKPSHVTVIRLNSTSERDISPTEKAAAAPVSDMVKTTTTTTTSAGFPLLPPPPTSGKNRAVTNTIFRPMPASPMFKTSSERSAELLQHHAASLSVDAASVLAKSRSLPRGLPSDGSAFNTFEHPNSSSASHFRPIPTAPGGPYNYMIQDSSRQMTKPDVQDMTPEELHWETLRLQLEYEELMMLKSELERRKRGERNEMEDLRDEIATMQTLYQYRTYSVDSSENSSDENSEKDPREEVEELGKVLSDLVRENTELEEKRLDLFHKIQEERSASIQLRVQIRLEQERIRRSQQK